MKECHACLALVQHGCFVMIHFLNRPQLLTQMEKVERHVADEPRHIPIITLLWVHTHSSDLFSIGSLKRLGLSSLLSLTCPPSWNSKTQQRLNCVPRCIYSL